MTVAEFREAWGVPNIWPEDFWFEWENPSWGWRQWAWANGRYTLLAILYEEFGVHPTAIPWPG